MKRTLLAVMAVICGLSLIVPQQSEAAYGGLSPDPGSVQGRWVAYKTGDKTRINTEDSYNPSLGTNGGITSGFYVWAGSPLVSENDGNPGTIEVFDKDGALYGTAALTMTNSFTAGSTVNLAATTRITTEITDVTVGAIADNGDGNVTVALSWTSAGAASYLVFYANLPCGSTGDSCAGLNSNGEYYLRGSTATNSATITAPHPSKFGGGDYDAWFLVIPVDGSGDWGLHSRESSKTNISDTLPTPTPPAPTATPSPSPTPSPTPTFTESPTPTNTSGPTATPTPAPDHSETENGVVAGVEYVFFEATEYEVRVTFTSLSPASGVDLTVDHYDSAHPEAGADALTVYWNLNLTGATNYSATVTFTYADVDVPAGVGEGQITAVRFNGTNFDVILSSLDGNLNEVTVTGVDQFSPWTLGPIDAFSTSVPTTSEWGVILLLASLSTAFYVYRRREEDVL